MRHSRMNASHSSPSACRMRLRSKGDVSELAILRNRLTFVGPRNLAIPVSGSCLNITGRADIIMGRLDGALGDILWSSKDYVAQIPFSII
jgi:hypothetical protein